ncbi:MAG: aminoacyl-tRNA hydrolase [Verrucomicrobiota bacterium]|nr:aminoacyl-tRNA hydrolase [Verrucomicrobiota bacterium]
MSIALVAGLGNPGREYEKTRHNLGFFVLDALAQKLGLAWQPQTQFDAHIARWDKAPGATWLLAKPQTFVNESGRSVAALAHFYKLAPADIIVAYDDLNIPLGRIKVSVTGSDGGHNGVASLLAHVGDGFARYRLGIGPKSPPQIDLKDFVLGKFSPSELALVETNLNQYLDGLRLLIDSGAASAMNQLNRKDRNDQT